MKILCELVTVIREQRVKEPLGNRKAYALQRSKSQETCLLGYRIFRTTSNWLYVFIHHGWRAVVFMLVFEKENGLFSYRRGGDDRKKLARGYTTGTCAQAATKAAAWMLLTGEKVRETEVILPNGETARFPIEGIKIEEEAVSCGVKKDSGDDPDITGGMGFW